LCLVQASAHLQGLYRIEAEIREQQLEGIDKLTYRATHAKPRVDAFFAWTETGAQQFGIIQSLISTCRLHAINPYL